MKKITKKRMQAYKNALRDNEKADTTEEKYLRQIRCFQKWVKNRPFGKAEVIAYKKELCKAYAPTSVNAAISALNSFFDFCGWYELRMKGVKIQRKLFVGEGKELTRAEYNHLITEANAKGKERLSLVMQTVGSTGIRISELRYITAEAVRRGLAEIDSKGKCRTVLLPKKLCGVLSEYMKRKGIQSGPVFLTRGEKPLDRSNIWSEMKALCKEAGVSPSKVFPHNLRHLFARIYYDSSKDVVRLADILGHSSINTTRIYTVDSGAVHRRQLESLGLLLFQPPTSQW